MNTAAVLWLVFSTLGGLPATAIPPETAEKLLAERLIQPVQSAHAIYYTIALAGYARFVRL